MKFILMGLVKQFTKEAGRSPNPVELTNLKKLAQEMERSEKVIPFPGGGRDKVNPFKSRPEGIIPTTIEGKTKNMSPEEIMDFLMKNKKGKDTNIGTAPKTTKTKPKVDPKLQAAEDQNKLFQDFSKRTETDAEIIARMNKQNKEAVKRLKEKKKKI